jgi:hypothetical protein
LRFHSAKLEIARISKCFFVILFYLFLATSSLVHSLFLTHLVRLQLQLLDF